MICKEAREQLTAYLDGELDGERGSAVRGHLRTCGQCRAIAGDEAALRDGLRTLPPVDPPSTLWSGVQARLAAAEMADAEKPAWRRAVRHWMSSIATPRVGIAGLAVAAATVVLAWRYSHTHEDTTLAITHHDVAPAQSLPVAPPPPSSPNTVDQDVTAAIADEPARVTDDYAQAADELLKLAQEARTQWTDERKQTFDTRVAELRHKIEAAGQPRKRQKAYRALIRYLQNAAISDEVALADVRGAQ